MQTRNDLRPVETSDKARKSRRPGLTSKGTVPDALINFDRLPDSAYVGQVVVEGLKGRSGASVWRDVASGRLPKPVKIGRSTKWNVGELRRSAVRMDADKAPTSGEMLAAALGTDRKD